VIFLIIQGDCRDELKGVTSDSIDLIFADPPYFLSNGGVSINSGKIVSVNKGDWDKKENYDDVLQFTKQWLEESKRVLKSTGTIWISGTHHNIFDIQAILKELDFKLINVIIWHKTDAPPLIYKNKFKFSYEFIIWAKKKNHVFNYESMFKIDNTEMEDVWHISAVQKYEKKYGYHPTQKPMELLERIIKSATKKGDVVLDPFMGSGTTCYVAKKLGRRYIGIEKETQYFELSQRRIESI
jgi:site-specific DNA-methyltransferase (adenine-specific)